MIKKYELEVIIMALEQCDGEFGLATNNKEAFIDLNNKNIGLREYNNKVFLNCDILIDKLKLINKPVETTNEYPLIFSKEEIRAIKTGLDEECSNIMLLRACEKKMEEYLG